MADDFPTEFDFIVIGTGLPESILAAAFSRIGQRVLHIDRNGYYSGRWCSFNLHAVNSWLSQAKGEDDIGCPDADRIKSLLSEGEETVALEVNDNSYSHTNVEFNIGDDEIPQELEEDKSSMPPSKVDNSGNQNETDDNTNQSAENVTANDGKCDEEKTDDSSKQSTTEENNENENVVKDDETENEAVDEKPESVKKKGNMEEERGKWTKSRLDKEWRKFNLDLTPKLLYCGGSMVQLLITSDIAKYCEFKTVTRMLTLLDGKLEKVPCSRADVFNSKKVSMLEKRMLMKFLTSCAEYDKNLEDYEAFSDKPFTEYLNSKKLTKNIKHYVQHSIAMATSETTTLEGLEKTKKFLHSLGRYGNTAFLWPLYGCGELPQSFCRMCAVFGGVYCLKMSASHLIIDKDKKCTGVISTDGKKLSAKYVILEESSVPTNLFNSNHKRYLSRAVLITDKSMLHDESQQLSVLQIPDKDGRCLTRIIELPPSSMSSPSPLHVVHVTKVTEDGTSSPQSDLQETVNELFKTQATLDDSKPMIMWSLYFKREFYSDVTVDRTTVPDNVIVIPGPGPQIDLDIVVDETKEIFEKLMPGEDFLPRPPNPEDIIYVDDAENAVANETNQSDFTNDSENQSESVTIENSESESVDQSDLNETPSHQSESGDKLMPKETNEWNVASKTLEEKLSNASVSESTEVSVDQLKEQETS